MKFNDLGIHAPILKALREVGYTSPTPIQQKAIPPVLVGRDLLGCAQTGTGKTAAFALPILQRLSRAKGNGVRALILTPTRELALQIYENVCQYARYTPCMAAVIFGGVSQIPQVEALERGADILIATPGRLWDLMGQKLVSLAHVEFFVLDEADRMLDMGFINDVRKIAKFIPENRQTLLFSATMPPEIASLADSLLKKPMRISVAPAATPVELIDQKVYFVERAEKRELLKALLKEQGVPQTLVFTRTKHGADRVARELNRAGISARALHGDKSQGARQAALRDFKSYKIAVLVATDIAARGLDISELPLVINFELPNIPETYVHRIGRTGRAGQSGMAISFCDSTERPYLADIEKLTHQQIPVVSELPKLAAEPARRPSSRRIAEPVIPAVTEAPSPRGRRSTAHRAPVIAAVPEAPEASRRSRRTATPARSQSTAEPRPSRSSATEAPRARGKHNAHRTPVVSEPPRVSAGKSTDSMKPQRRPGNHSSAAPSNHQKRGKRPARGADRFEDNTRVDIATPVNPSHISAEAAARIRAKVEAKLAERARHEADTRRPVPPARKPAAHRSQRGRKRY